MHCQLNMHRARTEEQRRSSHGTLGAMSSIPDFSIFHIQNGGFELSALEASISQNIWPPETRLDTQLSRPCD